VTPTVWIPKNQNSDLQPLEVAPMRTADGKFACRPQGYPAGWPNKIPEPALLAYYRPAEEPLPEAA